MQRFNNYICITVMTMYLTKNGEKNSRRKPQNIYEKPVLLRLVDTNTQVSFHQ